MRDYLATAIDLQQQTDALFLDEKSGGYFFSAADNEELLVRQKEVYDGAIPSGNSMAADNLVRLARLTGRNGYEESADRVFSAFASQVAAQPSAHSQLVSAFQHRIGASLEIVIVGDPASPDTHALIDTARSTVSAKCCGAGRPGWGCRRRGPKDGALCRGVRNGRR